MTDLQEPARDQLTGSDTEADRENDLSKPWDESDIVFLVEEKEIHICSQVLCIQSPVFKAMLRGDFKERNSKAITLPGKTYRSMLKLFQICHDPEVEVDESCVTDILPLAREYQMKGMRKMCEKLLLTKSASISNLIIAREYGLKELERKCMEYAKRSPLADLKTENNVDDMITDVCAEFLLDKVERYEPLVNILKHIREDIMLKLECGRCKNSCIQCGQDHRDECGAATFRTEIRYDRRKNYSVRVPDIYLCKPCTVSRFQKIHDKLKDMKLD